MKKWWKKKIEGGEIPEPVDSPLSLKPKSSWIFTAPKFSDHDYPVTFDLASGDLVSQFKDMQTKDEQIKSLLQNLDDPIEHSWLKDIEAGFTIKTSPKWDVVTSEEILADIKKVKEKWFNTTGYEPVQSWSGNMNFYKDEIHLWSNTDSRPDTESEVWD